jgi:hypothetical protein
MQRDHRAEPKSRILTAPPLPIPTPITTTFAPLAPQLGHARSHIIALRVAVSEDEAVMHTGNLR